MMMIALVATLATAPVYSAQGRLANVYCVGESERYRIVSVSEVFQWRGPGPIPLVAMGYRFSSAMDIPFPPRVECHGAFADEGQDIEALRQGEISRQRLDPSKRGWTVEELPFSYRE